MKYFNIIINIFNILSLFIFYIIIFIIYGITVYLSRVQFFIIIIEEYTYSMNKYFSDYIISQA